MKENRQHNPLVSVIINNYNYGRFLREAIESALTQTYPYIEVIVVDDGSTDHSREVIAYYKGQIRVVLKENGGQGSAFNAGFAISRGDIVIFLDADDVLLSNAVEEVVAVWKPEVSKVQWRLLLVTEKLEPMGQTWPMERRLPSGSVRESLLRWRYYPSPPTSGNAFSRWLLEKILPMPESEWRIAADSYLLTLAGMYGNIQSIDRELGYYRVHGRNLWHFSGWNAEELVKKLVQQVVTDIQQQNLLQEAARSLGVPFHPIPTPLAAKTEMALALLRPDALIRLGLSSNRAKLALQGTYASLVYPYMPSFLSRVRLSAWFLLTGVLPRFSAVKVALWGVVPSVRPRWLARILQASGS
ncbi:MAG: glycosyltransferase family 2 protein [Thermus sp.]|uniref:glycosyltransferase family 2 protein n=1 Tax=Thermus sp. TaxID=275 RepID=UPI00391D1517